MIYFEAQNHPEIGPLRPIFNTLLKIAQIDMYTKTVAKFFEKMTKDYNFYLYLGTNWPNNWASEANILQTSNGRKQYFRHI